MKDYSNMIDDLFKRRDEYITQKRKKTIVIKKVTSLAIGCILILISINYFNTYPNSNLSVNNETVAITTKETQVAYLSEQSSVPSETENAEHSKKETLYNEDVCDVASSQSSTADLSYVYTELPENVLIDYCPDILEINIKSIFSTK